MKCKVCVDAIEHFLTEAAEQVRNGEHWLHDFLVLVPAVPLKLVQRRDKTSHWYVRGSYLGIRVRRSTGTAEKRVARAVRRRWKEAIERGEYAAVDVRPTESPITFLDAANAYMKAGGERKHLSLITEMTGEHALQHKTLASIDQIAIDNAAVALYPNASAATRNRQFYTPVSAVLHHAGLTIAVKRPKGWRGTKSQSWLEPEQAFRLFAEADALDTEFGLFCRVLFYTGMRLSEALAIRIAQLNMNARTIYLPKTKNGEARAVHLPPVLIAALANQPPRRRSIRPQGGGPQHEDIGVPFLERHAARRLFRFHAGGALRDMLKTAMKNARLSFPPRQGGFHIFCHSYGTLMSRYGALDTYGLVRTGRWADPRSADRYRHSKTSEEARRADLLPTPANIRECHA